MCRGLIKTILEKAMWKPEGAEAVEVDMLSEQLDLITLFWEKDGEDDDMRMVVGMEKSAGVGHGYYEWDGNGDDMLGGGIGVRVQNDVKWGRLTWRWMMQELQT